MHGSNQKGSQENLLQPKEVSFLQTHRKVDPRLLCIQSVPIKWDFGHLHMHADREIGMIFHSLEGFGWVFFCTEYEYIKVH